MRRMLPFILLLVLLASMASASDMWREYEFEMGETKTYNYLGDTYEIRVMGLNRGGSGEADIRINDFKKTVRGTTPVYFEDMKVTLKDSGRNNVTLRMEWHREEEKPDVSQYLSQNLKSSIEAGGKEFVIVFKKYNGVRKKATIEVNGEPFVLGIKEKVKLEDGSELKLDDIVGTNIKRVKVSVWASESDTYEKEEEEVFDFSRRITEGQELSAEVKGRIFNIRLSRVEENATIVFEGETYTFSDGDKKEVGSSVVLKASQFTLRDPKGVKVEMRVPESDVETEVVERTLSIGQKDSFEVFGRNIVTQVLNITSSSARLKVNGKEVNMSRGETVNVSGVSVVAKIVNMDSIPPRAIFRYVITEKIKERSASEAGEEGNETDGNETTEPEVIEENETAEPVVEDEIVNETDEVPADENVSEEPKEPSNFSKSISNGWQRVKETAGKVGSVFDPITNFFKWAFG